MGRLIDLTGQRFERLLVIKLDKPDQHRQMMWLCVCDCGNLRVACGVLLRQKKVRSCGCLAKESIINRSMTHQQCMNGVRTKEYNTWHHMKSRCSNIKNSRYSDYGGRGIKVCNRWLQSFENFFEDMGKAPTLKHSIDRIDNDGNYEPANCRWATAIEQANNKRTNIMIGDISLKAICKEQCLPYHTIYQRICRLGWSMEKALSTPIRRRNTK